MLALFLAIETAMVVESTGQAIAVTSETTTTTSTSTKAVSLAQAQDEASAVLMARLQNRKIEVLSERTADSTTYALPDGTLSAEAYAGPIRVKQNGVWTDIDTSLSDTGVNLTPEAAAADIVVSDGGDKSLASVSKGETSFGLGWEDKLPTPTVEDATASYDLGSGQTLKVTALAQGFSENMVLTQQPDAATSYRIPLDLKGLTLSQAASGHLLLKDSGGKLVAEAPAPMMWDASKDAASGESAHQEQVATKVETADDGSQTLVLTPAADFLATATYPVTVDPTSTLAVTTDTWVQTPDYTDSQVSSTELKSGTYDSGSDVARAYLKFDVSKFTGKDITSATMSLYNYYSATCSTSGAVTQARRITSTWSSSSVTWSSQPSTTTTDVANNTGHWGYSSSCPAAYSNWNLQAIVQAWANGATNYGLQIRSADESDSTTWRRFRSANYGTSGYAPKLVVNYNSYATTSGLAVSPSSVNAYSGKRYVTTYTPTLSAKVTDADGSTVKGQFEITNDPSYSGETSYSYTATSASVSSGGTAKLTIPAASQLAAAHLRMRVRGYDGVDYGSWSSYIYFVPNVAKPNAPAVSCATYAQDTWVDKASGSVTCTLDTSSTDGQGYLWGLDDSTTPKSVYDTVDGNGGDPLTLSITPDLGWHTLYAKTIDSGGNISTATTSYNFGVGAEGAGLLTPGNGDSTARRVSLTSTGKSTYTGVTYQYRHGETDIWTNVPVTHVTKTSDGSAVSAWPVAVTSGAPAPLTWDVTSSVSTDGPIDIRAAFTDGSTTGYSQSNTVTVDRNAGTAPSEDIGPGAVNALTGDFTVSETDASAFGMSVSRMASSRRPTAGSDATGQTAIFGSQWTSGVIAELTDSDWSYLKQSTATSVALVDVDGDETGFTATSAGGWKPEPGSEDLTLTQSATTGDFTLKDDQGTTTTFAKVASTATTWQVSTTSPPTTNSSTEVASELAPGSTTLSRPKYLIAPTSAVSQSVCQSTPSAVGCRVLEFVYATSTSATGSSTGSDFGNYTGRVQEIREWSTAPGATAATYKTVATYRYDADGKLRQEWNPNLSQATQTQYSYDSAGRITGYQSQSQLAWTFTYDTAGSGMLLTASRPTLAQGSASTLDGNTATTSVVYDVPLSGTDAPNQMSTSDVDDWGQTDVPADATAVFPPDAVPASHTGSGLSATDYTRATITYTDASGREVNTASPGGHVTTTGYDRFGNSVMQLTAGNRELALTPATSGDSYDELSLLHIAGDTTSVRAGLLSTLSTYSTDGLQKLDEKGPLHMATLTSALAAGSGGTDLPAGTSWPLRSHTVNTYDEGRPTDGTANVTNQVTTTKTGAWAENYPSDADVRTSTTAYDWVKGLPTTQVTDPGGLAITTTTSYDSQGRVIKTTQPASSGTDADTTVTTYYSATGTGTCNGSLEWADQVCSTGPAGAITGGGTNPTQLPTKTIQYDWWGNQAIVTETANSVTRTATHTYDSAGRVLTTAITGGTGTAVPDTSTTYDPSTGRVATVATSAGTVSHTYDQLGREIAYTDGAGNTATKAYDALDRPVKTTDSAPSTTTYTYDTTLDPRGLETSRTDSVAGTFSAGYDADGDLATETLPGGYTLTDTQDETGAETSRVYSLGTGSDATVVASDAADHTVQGQTVADVDSNGQTRSRSYTYDAAGRLTQADDTAADSSCTRRNYTFDNNTNRTALAVSTSDVGSACSSTGATTTSYTYDTADRLTTSGTVYDAFGRTTTQASGTTIGYYTNDLVHQQTSGTNRQTWTLDATGRLAAWTTESNSGGTWTQIGSKTNHYGADGDSPDWTQETSSTLTRNVQGISGDLDATTSATGSTVLQLTDLHGDTTVQLPVDTSVAPTAQSYDEFGNAEDSTAATRYGWLGGKQRSSETVTSAILMGVRLYDPTIGRFLQIDPVPGGSANAYDYCGGDPVNQFDLDGQSFWGRTWSFVKNHRTTILTVGSFIPVVGEGFAVAAMISGAYDAYNDYRHGDYVGAALDVAGVFSGGASYGYRFAARSAERRAARLARGRYATRRAFHRARRAMKRRGIRYHRYRSYSDRFGWGAGAAYEGRYWWHNRHHYF
ncbi:DNRLRE domain-containing protein [Streptomyces sp. SID12501]|uniref:DNRLRE domain-containing protein n=1 Tax=Streptomyces sp. SID12501 TaxID=2706042 RepID=UPI0031BA9FF4